MNPERWHQVRDLLTSAMELDPVERSAFLDRHCSSDPGLRQELDKLLSVKDEVPSSFLGAAALEEAASQVISASENSRVATGTRLGPYEVQELLGAGGMGEVYRARDTRLDRTVAIKVLPGTMSTDSLRRQRFEREARAISALQHPNICTLYDVGVQERIQYLVMEYLEGETLASRLASGPLQLELTLRYATEITDAVDMAHKRGIVHRDLKPGNIFLTTHGEAKVLDFGLAKLDVREPAADSPTTLTSDPGALTTPGLAMGTVAYMSPEQVRGQVADHRSDIFAFGAILYEMLSGKRAFQGDTTADTISAILNKEPKSISEVVPNVSRALGQIVHRCLEKDPASRYQSSVELISSLEECAAGSTRHEVARVTRPWKYGLAAVSLAVLLAVIFGFTIGGWRDRLLHGISSGTIRSLAVLPLTNLTGDSGQEYFVDGMTDQLITELAQIPRLRVTSRTSAMQFKETKKLVSQIAMNLNVDAVVEGSVMRSSDRVRITVQLIEAKTDRHLWARSYERNSRDIMALQDELARDIAGEIRVTLTPEEHKRLAARAPNPDAYDAYLRGRYFWSLRTEVDLHKAKDYFEQAIAADPGYAPAYSGLADTYFYLSYAWGHMLPLEGMPLARKAALKGLELDDSSAEAHTSLALVKMSYDWDFLGAEQEFKRATSLNPNYATAHQGYSILLGLLGHPEESIAEIRKAVEVDPLSIPVRSVLAARLALYSRCDESLEENRRTLELDPNATHLSMLHDLMAGCYRTKGMDKESLEEWTKARIANGATPQEIEDFQRTYATSGRNAVLRKDLQALLRRWEKDHWHRTGWEIAMAYANLGENDQAFSWIDKLIQLRSTALFWLYDSGDPLLKDPRFEQVKRKMGVQNQI